MEFRQYGSIRELFLYNKFEELLFRGNVNTAWPYVNVFPIPSISTVDRVHHISRVSLVCHAIFGFIFLAFSSNKRVTVINSSVELSVMMTRPFTGLSLMSSSSMQ